MKKILIIFPGGIGDVILLSPSLVRLREEYTNAQIDIILEPRSINQSRILLQELNPLGSTTIINEFKVFDFQNKFFKIPELLKAIQGYDTIISSGSSPFVSILLFLSRATQCIGFKSPLSFLLTDKVKLDKQQYASSMFGSLFSPLIPELKQQELIPILEQPPLTTESQGDYILIHPGVSSISLQKNIIKSPDKYYWKELIKQLCKQNKQVILTGGPDEQELLEYLTSADELASLLDKIKIIKPANMVKLAELIVGSQYFICVDSAPLHLAIAVKAKNIIALFAGTDEQKLVPQGQNNIHIITQDYLLCRPCLWDKRPNSCEIPLCAKLHNSQQVLNIIR